MPLSDIDINMIEATDIDINMIDRVYPLHMPTAHCAHCNSLIPLAMYLNQAGYCESCEFVTVAEAAERGMVHFRTVLYRLRKGRMNSGRIRICLRVYRCDVEAIVSEERASGRGWHGLVQH